MGTLMDFNVNPSGGGIVVKSVQQGMATLNAVDTINISITEVDMTRTVVIVNGTRFVGGTSTLAEIMVSGELTTDTNLQVTRGVTTDEIEFTWQVIEFDRIKSFQTGEETYTGTSHDLVISQVDLSKSIVITNTKTADGSTILSSILNDAFLFDSTNLRFLAHIGTISYVSKWYVVEFN